MKTLSFAVVAACVLVGSGCFVETHGGDPHRGWWEEHHRGEAYQVERAEREHREYCRRSYDRSYEGWYR